MDEKLDARALSRIVLADGWKPGAAEVDRMALVAAIEELSSPVTLADEDPGLSGNLAEAIENNLRPIGAKVSPTISDAQALAWRKAMVLALSDLPARIALYATGKAIHRPFKYLNEVEVVVREIATDAAERQQTARWRLKLWLEQVDRALMPQPQLAAPEEEPLGTQAEVDDLNATMRTCGLATRWALVEGRTVMVEPPSEERRAENKEI